MTLFSDFWKLNRYDLIKALYNVLIMYGPIGSILISEAQQWKINWIYIYGMFLSVTLDLLRRILRWNTPSDTIGLGNDSVLSVTQTQSNG